MPKRRHSLDSKSGYSSLSDSSYDEPAGPKSMRQSAKKQKRVRLTRQPHTAAENDAEPDSVDIFLNNPPSHKRDLHDIGHANEICLLLLSWYAGISESRGMPWRKPHDPSLGDDARSQRAYEVWVSEIMLQQTQVATVIPYYNRWMSRFPAVDDLAKASIDEVNSLWKGLGYYSRASRLLAGAQKVMKDFGGRMPTNAAEMEKLPGIGRYSAGAICSIAYGECVPVLDGNVHRLLSRFLALHAPPKAKATLDILWSAAAAIVKGVEPPYDPISTDADIPRQFSSGSESTDKPDIVKPARSMTHTMIGYAGDVNQALIELGSTVCKVRDPDCGKCPLRNRCAGHLRSLANELVDDVTTSVSDIEALCNVCEPVPHGSGVLAYPMKADRKKAREELDLVNVVEWRGPCGERRFLLVKRPDKGLLAGLLEFPTKANVPRTISSKACVAQGQAYLATLLRDNVGTYQGKRSRHVYRVTAVESAGDVLHVFSHIRKTYRVQWVLIEGGAAPPAVLVTQQSASSNGRKTAPESYNVPQTKDGEDLDDPDQSKISSLASWVSMDNIQNSNITTGVQKIWDLAKKLWT